MCSLPRTRVSVRKVMFSHHGGDTFSDVQRTYLHIGDVISLYAEGSESVSGFLSTLGLVDDRCLVRPGAGNPESPPSKFRDCHFRVCSVNRYAAQKQYWTEQKQFQMGLGSQLDDDMLNKLRVAAEKEKEQNDQEYRKLRGNVLKYGTTIQLLHVKSDKYLTVHKREPAKVERNAMKVTLDRAGNDGSWFIIEPVYRHCTVGDNVVAGDRVFLIPYNVSQAVSGTKHQLHVSIHSLPDDLPAKEVNCLNELTCWEVLVFLQFNEILPKVLKSGDVVRLFHADQQKFLTLDSYNDKDNVFLRTTARATAADATSSKALWEVEVVRNEPYRGGPASWQDTFRFKHLATDLYLAADEIPQNDMMPHASEGELNRKESTLSVYSSSSGSAFSPGILSTAQHQLVPVCPSTNDTRTIFEMDPCTLARLDALVPQQSFVRLSHCMTETWVHGTQYKIRADKEEPGWMKIFCTRMKEDKEAFAVIPVSPNEVRDLDFANDSQKALSEFVQKIRQGSNAQKEKNVISNLLVELIYFVTKTTNHMVDPLKIVMSKNDRDIQKLLREQGVLDQVFELVQVPFECRGDLPPLFDSLRAPSRPGNEAFRRIFWLAYTLLMFSQQGYRKNQEYMAKRFGDIQNQIGFELMAEDLITAILHNNPKILQDYVEKPHIETFVDLVRNNKLGKYLDYLADLCVCRGEANKKIQELICTSVLSEDNRNIFMPIHIGPRGDVLLCWPDSACRSLTDIANKERTEDDARRMLDYFQHQLNLLAQMCQDQQYLAINPPPERKLLNISKELPADVVLKCMEDECLPFDLRGAFARLMLHLHVVQGSHIPALRHARLWGDIPEKATPSANRNNEVDKNQGIVRFVDRYLDSLREVCNQGLLPLPAQQEQNQLTYEVVTLAKALAQYGSYNSLAELLKLARNLLDILDTRTGRKKLPTSSANIKKGKMLSRIGSTDSGMEEKGLTEAAKHTVVQIKLAVVEILQFILDVRRDYRITVALSWFKEQYPCGDSGDLLSQPDMTLRKAQELSDQVFTEAEDELEIGKERGKQLLRILLELTMADYPPLTSVALKVLFRHFTQRQELLEDMKQVQLLVSNKDKENYYQIDRDLFILKNLTEKSELWVYSSKKKDDRRTRDEESNKLLGNDDDFRDSELKSPRAFENEKLFEAKIATLNFRHPLSREDCYKLLDQILTRMTKLCYKEEGKPDIMNQQLLKNMGVHDVVLTFLSVPYDKKDTEMPHLLLLAHEFLRSFCQDNRDNQNRLHRCVTVSNEGNEGCLKVQTPNDVLTLTAIYKNHRDLCSNVTEQLIQHVVHLIDNQQSTIYLEFLQTVVAYNEQPIVNSQDKVTQEIVTATDEVRMFYSDSGSFETLEHLLETTEPEDMIANPTHPLAYHMELVRLLSLCTKGKVGSMELQCAPQLPMEHIVRVITHEKCPIELKEVYLQFMLHCYVDTEAELKDVYNADYIEAILSNVLGDIQTLEEEGDGSGTVLERYICRTVTELLTKFFEKPYSEPFDKSIDPMQHQSTFGKLLQRLGLLLKSEWLKEGNGRQSWYKVTECLKRLCKFAEQNGLTLPANAVMPPQSSTNAANKFKGLAKANTRFLSPTLPGLRKLLKTPSFNTFFDGSYSNVITCYHALVGELRRHLEPLKQAEASVLVDVLHTPEKLFSLGSRVRVQCEGGGVVAKLIQHCKLLQKNKQDTLCVRVLQTLCRMAKSRRTDFGVQGRRLRQELLDRYFGEKIQESEKKREKKTSPEVILLEIQSRLNKAGASDLVVDLIISDPQIEVFLRAVELAKALLDGGNHVVQETFYKRLKKSSTAEKFFLVFNTKMQVAQNRLKNDMLQSDGKYRRSYKSSPNHSRKSSMNPQSAPILSDPSTAEELSLKAQLQIWQKTNHREESFDQSTANGSFLGSIPDWELEDSLPKRSDTDVPEEVALMEPVLRFLQLLCENHNRDLQLFLRHQGTRTNYNMIAETLLFLDTICGSTKGSLGVFREITESNVSLINQTLVALTEYCQGPCHENQNTIAMHESNGLDIIISLVLNDIKPLADTHMELALEIKSNASKLLLAIMESRDDSENAERVLRNMSRMSGGPKQLVLAITGVYKLMQSSELQRHRDLSRQRCEQVREACNAYYRTHVPDISIGDFSGDALTLSILGETASSIDPKEVGHNIYILAHQLSRHSPELDSLLDPQNAMDDQAKEALTYYAKHTATIEVVRNDRTLERIVFPVPQICEYLTDETRQQVYLNTDRDEQGSKVTEFFAQVDSMFQEMTWQKKLRERNWLYQCTQRVQLWSRISFLFAFVINLLIALCYPFENADLDVLLSMSHFIWVCMGSTSLFAWTTPDSWIGLIALAMSSVSTCILTLGPVPTLLLLGVSQIINKCVHVISYVGNKGLVDKPLKVALFDKDLWYLVCYLGFCLVGFFGHPLLYAVLLFDVVLCEETLRNVIRSVTRNWQSIALTGMMALILVYCFSIVGYICFQQDFFLEVDGPLESPKTEGIETAGGSCAADGVNCEMETALTEDSANEERVSSCSTLRMCIVTTLNWGLRNGGGIGDILRKASPHEDKFLWRILYDMTFFVVLIIIVLNLIFGVIIDTFGDLRNEKQEKEHILKDTCFICGLDRSKFDNRTVSFEEHIIREHNLWHYLYFVVLLKVKDKTEFTGPESFVCSMVQEGNLDWFPRMQAILLTAGEEQNEQNEIKELHEQLKQSQTALKELAVQIDDLKQAMSRKHPRRGKMEHMAESFPSYPAGDVAQRFLYR